MTTAHIYAIMPVFSDEDYEAKRKSLVSASYQLGVPVHFPLDHGIPHPGEEFDLEIALTELKQALGVIVDLSLERPSCYYELGLAQALRKPVALVARTGTTIHQAYGRHSVIEYSSINDHAEAVRAALQSLIP